MAKAGGEPSSAPQPERWYELKLGSTFNDRPSSKFCTLRYEFKPASIDKNQPGMLHKTKDNRVTVEFNNNQLGKPKVTFEGTSEECKDSDGILFFDGESFRLERLHRAVKRLRHVRLPGESAAATINASTVSTAPAIESRSPPVGKITKAQILNKSINHAMPLEVERIDLNDPESSGPKPTKRPSENYQTVSVFLSTSPVAKTYEPEENVDILADDDSSPPKVSTGGLDVILPSHNDTDDEIADVDLSDDEGNKGPNAAEALRAQVNAAEEGQLQDQQQGGTSSSSGSSGSGSSGSGSGSGSGSSSSSESDSDGDSASSGREIDI